MPLTTFRLVTISPTDPTLIFAKDKSRIGYTIINRTTVDATLWISKSSQLLGFTSADYSQITLLQNESITLLKSEGDDCTQELWGIAFALLNIEVVETTKTEVEH